MPAFLEGCESEPSGEITEVFSLHHDPLEALIGAIRSLLDETSAGPAMHARRLGGHVFILEVVDNLVDQIPALHGLLGVPSVDVFLL